MHHDSDFFYEIYNTTNEHNSSFIMVSILLIVIVNWIVHMSNFLRSFMISFEHGLILLRYCLTDSAFLSTLFLYSM